MGTLYLVSTPIGNLEDISFRAIKVLKEVDFIFAEDTRKSKNLLNKYEIKTHLQSFHSYSSSNIEEKIISYLKEGKNLALISDAGTPGISDPAFSLTSKLVKLGINLIPIPGPSAFLTALTASACPINHFWYLGFLPIKKGRKTILSKMYNFEDTIVFYESVHRIEKTIKELILFYGEDKSIIIGRELTKIYEDFFRGTLKEAQNYLKKKLKGEFVIILPPKNFKF
jgi:16S rRNA (cytidine1402-2'-O)-methyltransferase